MSIRIFHNDEMEAITMACPTGHKHLRAAISTHQGDTFVLPEAIIAALVRAYIQIKTHPSIHAVRMISREIDSKKKDFADFQFVEVESNEEVIEESMAKIVDVLDRVNN